MLHRFAGRHRWFDAVMVRRTDAATVSMVCIEISEGLQIRGWRGIGAGRSLRSSFLRGREGWVREE
jgi:hypothetical protein